jgi:hypothetical protein
MTLSAKRRKSSGVVEWSKDGARLLDDELSFPSFHHYLAGRSASSSADG